MTISLRSDDRSSLEKLKSSTTALHCFSFSQNDRNAPLKRYFLTSNTGFCLKALQFLFVKRILWWIWRHSIYVPFSYTSSSSLCTDGIVNSAFISRTSTSIRTHNLPGSIRTWKKAHWQLSIFFVADLRFLSNTCPPTLTYLCLRWILIWLYDIPYFFYQ